jgi:molybdopterin-binding protein
MQISARNVFRGTVVSVKTGAVMANVRVDIGGGNVVSALISAEAVDELGLGEGVDASVVIKATEVIVAR